MLTSIVVGGAAIALVRGMVGVGEPTLRRPDVIGQALRLLVAWPVYASFGLLVAAGAAVRGELPAPLKAAGASMAVAVVVTSLASAIGVNAVRPLFNACGPVLAIAAAFFAAKQLRLPRGT
jgi:hypothetical protein